MLEDEVNCVGSLPPFFLENTMLRRHVAALVVLFNVEIGPKWPFGHVRLPKLVLDLTNLQLLEKVSSLVHFDYFPSQARFFGIFSLLFQKTFIKKRSV